MSDETGSIADALRESVNNSLDAYEEAVEAGTSLQNEDGTPANFATDWMVSRLMQAGYGDAFSLSDHTWSRAHFAQEVRQFVEDEVIGSYDREDGQFGLELAFMAIDQVDWVAVGLVLRRQMIERNHAMKRLKQGDDAVIPSVESQEMSPEEWERLQQG